MTEGFGDERDLVALVVPRVGAVVVSDDLWEPVRLTDAAGEVSRPVAAFLKDLQAAGRSVATQRSYAMVNRPGSDGGSQSTEDESHASTEEVRRRAA
jgi:hypothetical protein